LGWASYYPDENNWLNDVVHCTESENRQNRPCTPTDEIISQANLASEHVERLALYRQAERELFGEEGIIPLSPLFVRAEYLLRHGWVDFNRAHFGGEQYDTYLVDGVVKSLERER
jgi:ABC-type oligopeptide transport system substrate-binding subunit